MTSKYNQFENSTEAIAATTGGVAMTPVGYNNYHVNQHPTVLEIPAQQKRYRWCDFVMSIIMFFGGCICCMNPVVLVFSALGMIYSANSYSSHGDKAWERSTRQSRIAKIFWVISLVIVIISAVVLLILTIVLVRKFQTAEAIESSYLHHLNRNRDSFDGR